MRQRLRDALRSFCFPGFNLRQSLGRAFDVLPQLCPQAMS